MSEHSDEAFDHWLRQSYEWDLLGPEKQAQLRRRHAAEFRRSLRVDTRNKMNQLRGALNKRMRTTQAFSKLS